MRDGFDSNIRYGTRALSTYFVHVDISQTDHSLFLEQEKNPDFYFTTALFAWL